MNFIANTGTMPALNGNDILVLDFGFQDGTGVRDIRVYHPHVHSAAKRLEWSSDDRYPILAYAIIRGQDVRTPTWLDALYDSVDDGELVYVQLRNRDTDDTVTLHRRDALLPTEGDRWFRSKNSYATLEDVLRRFPNSQYYLNDFAVSNIR